MKKNPGFSNIFAFGGILDIFLKPATKVQQNIKVAPGNELSGAANRIKFAQCAYKRSF
jgi:hypothetical protein